MFFMVQEMDFIIVMCQLLREELCQQKKKLLREELNHYYRSNQILSVISFDFSFTIKIKTRANFVSM
jgi:protein-tyrosine-phosphatase